MRSTVALSITLPHKMAAMVRKKVKSGEYASESEVIREGLRILKDREETYEDWVRSEVRKSIAEFRADPSSAIPLEKLTKRYSANAHKPAPRAKRIGRA
jgi:putative addiction module CopG family antidote